ncbi:hypothetical protein EPO15_18015 [bacterium]|nr:MAG: hypothetical protein EPO15_18015 [bacterium]
MEHAALAVALAASLAAPSLDGVFERLRDRTDPQGQVEAAAELSRRAGGLDLGDQHRAVTALAQAASDSFSAGQVRGKALDALGRSAGAMSDEQSRREAVRTLLEHAAADGPQDFRTETKVYALRGLAQAAARLPSDDETRAGVLGAALDAMRGQSRPAERTQGAMLLDSALRGGALGAMLRSYPLKGRFEYEVVSPLEGGGLSALYSDAQGTLEYRYFLMRSLALMGRVIGSEPNLPHRCRAILSAMAQSDPDPRLREMARLYSYPSR